MVVYLTCSRDMRYIQASRGGCAACLFSQKWLYFEVGDGACWTWMSCKEVAGILGKARLNI